MKKLTLFLLISCVFWSCKDKSPIIIPSENPFEVFPSKFIQNILLEEFTAEWCGPCVNASKKIDALKIKYPNRIHVASLHSDDWLEIPFKNTLANLLGGLVSIPRASINRTPAIKTYNNLDNTYTILTIENWDSEINRHISNIPKFSIALETTTNSNSLGDINIYIAQRDTSNLDTRIGVYFTEDNIQSVNQQGANSSYLHDNVVSEIYEFEDDKVDLKNIENNLKIIRNSIKNINLNKFNLSKLKAIVYIYNYNSDFRKIQVLNSQEVQWGGNKYWDIN